MTDRTAYLERAEERILDIRQEDNPAEHCAFCTVGQVWNGYMYVAHRAVSQDCPLHGDFETVVYHLAEQLMADDAAHTADQEHPDR